MKSTVNATPQNKTRTEHIAELLRWCWREYPAQISPQLLRALERTGVKYGSLHLAELAANLEQLMNASKLPAKEEAYSAKREREERRSVFAARSEEAAYRAYEKEVAPLHRIPLKGSEILDHKKHLLWVDVSPEKVQSGMARIQISQNGNIFLVPTTIGGCRQQWNLGPQTEFSEGSEWAEAQSIAYGSDTETAVTISIYRLDDLVLFQNQ